MVAIENVIRGITAYADNEVLPHLPDTKACLLGAAVALMLRSPDKLLDKIPKALDVVNENNMIDVDALRDAFKHSMRNEMSFDIPMIGKINFDASEIDKLYDYIQRY